MRAVYECVCMCVCANGAGLTAVHVATREASIDILKFLFQMGSNKNAQVRSVCVWLCITTYSCKVLLFVSGCFKWTNSIALCC